MHWSDRNCLNKLFYVIFRINNLIYTSFYYYFMPWIASLLITVSLLTQNHKIMSTMSSGTTT